MILYKYVSFDTGKKILEKCSIGFSQPIYFNDPFDLPKYPHGDDVNQGAPLVSSFRTSIKNYIWSENTGVLCLTRTATNPLMWAHYGGQHEGMVIGIDAVAAGFTSEEINLIPAQYGSVIYVSRWPNHPFVARPASGLAVGATHYFPHDQYEKLQRLFLHKSICWAYEEEVRILKCLERISENKTNTKSGEFQKIYVKDRPLFILSMSENAIREVYFGCRMDYDVAHEFHNWAVAKYPHLNVHKCQLNNSSLSLGYIKYNTIAESDLIIR